MSSRYQKGYRRERMVREHLQKQGFLVFRSAASKGPWDLIAVKDHIILFIQVKSQKPTAKDREIFKTITFDRLIVHKQIWVYTPYKGFKIYHG